MITVEWDQEAYRDLLDVLTPERITRAVSKAVKRSTAEALRLSRSTVSTWEVAPSFEALEDIDVVNGTASFLVGTDDPIYRYVNMGTGQAAGHRSDRYPIRPVRAKALRFQVGYNAKTKPGSLQSGAGGPFGETVYRQVVYHPGIKPRNFSARIIEIVTPEFIRDIWRGLETEWRKQKQEGRKRK